MITPNRFGSSVEYLQPTTAPVQPLHLTFQPPQTDLQQLIDIAEEVCPRLTREQENQLLSWLEWVSTQPAEVPFALALLTALRDSLLEPKALFALVKRRAAQQPLIRLIASMSLCPLFDARMLEQWLERFLLLEPGSLEANRELVRLLWLIDRANFQTEQDVDALYNFETIIQQQGLTAECIEECKQSFDLEALEECLNFLGRPVDLVGWLESYQNLPRGSIEAIRALGFFMNRYVHPAMRFNPEMARLCEVRIRTILNSFLKAGTVDRFIEQNRSSVDDQLLYSHFQQRLGAVLERQMGLIRGLTARATELQDNNRRSLENRSNQMLNEQRQAADDALLRMEEISKKVTAQWLLLTTIDP